MYESMFLYETLVDLTLDVADLLGGMKEIRRGGSRQLRLRSIESRLEMMFRMKEEVSWRSNQESVLTRMTRVRDLVKNLLRDDEVHTAEGRYEKAAAVWRSGVHRHDKMEVGVDRENRTVLGELSQQVYVVTGIEFDHNGCFGVDYGVVSQKDVCLGGNYESIDDEEE